MRLRFLTMINERHHYFRFFTWLLLDILRMVRRISRHTLIVVECECPRCEWEEMVSATNHHHHGWKFNWKKDRLYVRVGDNSRSTWLKAWFACWLLVMVRYGFHLMMAIKHAKFNTDSKNSYCWSGHIVYTCVCVCLDETIAAVFISRIMDFKKVRPHFFSNP